MKKYIVLLFVVVFTLLINDCFSQTYEKQVLARQDSFKVEKFVKNYKIYLEKKDFRNASDFLNQIARIYWNKNHFEKSVEFYVESLKYNERLGNENGIAGINTNLGMIYADLGQYENSVKHLSKAVAARRASKDTKKGKEILFNALLNLASSLKHLKKYNEAIKYLEEALVFAQELNNLEKISVFYLQLAEAHENAGNKAVSQQYLSKYLMFYKQMSDEEVVQSQILADNERQKAEKEKIKSEKIALEKKIKELELNKEIKKKEEEVKVASSKADSLTSTLSKAELAQKALENEAIALEQKARAEKVKRQQGFIILGGIILIFIIIAGLFYYAFRQKKKANIELENKNHEILQQQKEIQIQSEQILQQNDELHTINQIVQAINSEIHFTNLLMSFLKSFETASNADRTLALILDKTTNTYKFEASTGIELSKINNIELSLKQVVDNYLSNSKELYDGIYLNQDEVLFEEFSELEYLEKPKSSLVIVVEVREQIKGILILSNMKSSNAFGDSDISMATNLSDHIFSAFIKAEILDDLQKTLTDLKEMQEELIRKEKLASIGLLIRGIVDRVINPLNYINNFSQISGELTEEINEILDEIGEDIDTEDREDIDEVTSMISSNLKKVHSHGLSATRVIKGMEKLVKERSNQFIETDINTFIKSSIELAYQNTKKEFEKIDAEILFEFDKNINIQKILPTELTEAIQNILNNSCYALNEKALNKQYSQKIEIKTKLHENEFEIIIKDNGIGMAKIEVPQVFDPLFTTKPTAKGTGLGLYITQDIIKLHKGVIVAESDKDKFTSVSIKIPIK